ncbi:MAG TPA: hypothetical protein VFD49_16485 [Candidatus Dormibacteraeota bacterium]|nr:hypothetical protein [Candidatus Dormibacteraeota bacterium]
MPIDDPGTADEERAARRPGLGQPSTRPREVGEVASRLPASFRLSCRWLQELAACSRDRWTSGIYALW